LSLSERSGGEDKEKPLSQQLPVFRSDKNYSVLKKHKKGKRSVWDHPEGWNNWYHTLKI
jgi:hypothetical protein